MAKGRVITELTAEVESEMRDSHTTFRAGRADALTEEGRRAAREGVDRQTLTLQGAEGGVSVSVVVRSDGKELPLGRGAKVVLTLSEGDEGSE